MDRDQNPLERRALRGVPGEGRPEKTGREWSLRDHKSLLHGIVCLTALVALLAWAGTLQAAPKADLWTYWEQHRPDSQQRVDHSAWDRLLKRYVVQGDTGVNLVRYSQVSHQDKAKLDGYLQRLQQVEVRSLRRGEQLAYWINLYNALTVQLVLEHYPVDSIKDIDISPGLFSVGPWDKKLVNVEGKKLSLNDIEHRILRPIWEDPRIHYAVNCASLGCPNLQREAFTAENAEELMEKGAREYINHPRGAELIDSELVASSIYDWFQEDFGGTEAGVIDHLMGYASQELLSRLREARGIDEYRYDWSLNGWRKAE